MLCLKSLVVTDNFRPCVRWGPSPPPNGVRPSMGQKLGRGIPSPIFGPCLLWPNSWMDQDATWYGGRPCPRPHCARWGPSSPPQKEHSSPRFLAPVCSGQTAKWIKMPLGMEVCLGPGHTELDPVPVYKKGAQSPNFWPMSIVAKRSPSTCTDSFTWKFILKVLNIVRCQCSKNETISIIHFQYRSTLKVDML